MLDGCLVVPPGMCGRAGIGLAHRLMREHRGCRIDRCGWKWIAYRTLVAHGRIVPQAVSPRERAWRRGLDFPVQSENQEFGYDATDPETLRRVLDELIQPGRCGEG